MKRLLLYTILPSMLAAIIGFYAGQYCIRHRITAGMSGGSHADATFTGLRKSLKTVGATHPRNGAPCGTLMLTSVPTGASISVNQKRQAEATPAQLRLPPGSYKVTVGKDGLTHTLSLELHNGDTAFRKVWLQQ